MLQSGRNFYDYFFFMVKIHVFFGLAMLSPVASKIQTNAIPNLQQVVI
jgi:hypothetical protein